ncbi:MAG: hypothetical protein IPM39_01880 [Chloroflexi bacterium]|nr:hypothetical protein [Chloroflexota bacterium]
MSGLHPPSRIKTLGAQASRRPGGRDVRAPIFKGTVGAAWVNAWIEGVDGGNGRCPPPINQ